MLKKIITNCLLLTVVAITFVTASLIIDIVRGEIEWFHRSGCVMTLIGVVISARELITDGIEQAINSKCVINGGTWPSEGNDLKTEATRNVIATAIAPYLIIIGGAVWGYGDLLMKLIIST